jgi:hypothetical protein
MAAMKSLVGTCAGKATPVHPELFLSVAPPDGCGQFCGIDPAVDVPVKLFEIRPRKAISDTQFAMEETTAVNL